MTTVMMGIMYLLAEEEAARLRKSIAGQRARIVKRQQWRRGIARYVYPLFMRSIASSGRPIHMMA